MSQFGSSEPADPWNDETVRQDVPSSAPPATSVPAAAPFEPGLAQPQYGQPQFQPQYQPQQPPAGYPPYEQPHQEPKKSPAVIILSILLVAVVVAAAGIVIYLWQTSGSNESPPPVPTVGECLVTDASADNPLFTESNCDPGAYKVLKVARGTVDTTICDNVPNATNNYVYQWPHNPTINDYVLCLQKL